MKCKACGYEKSEEWETEDGLAKGDKDFIRIKGVGFKIDAEMRWGEQSKEVFLYACPECKTVKMESGW